MMLPKLLLVATLGRAALAQTTTASASVSASSTTHAEDAAVTGCHAHGSDIYCINAEGDEVLVSLTATPTGELPAQYTDCHAHDEEMYCVDPDGNDVLVLTEDSAAEDDHSEEEHDHSGEEEHDHSEEEDSHSEGEGEMECHFHAGVEHCVPVGSSESGSSSAASCERTDREYDIGLRVGTLFVILATSTIGVFLPMFLNKLPFQSVNDQVFTIVKQFGTGVIISTAFIHLYTHAYMMFNNECLGGTDYEGTTSAVVMAGIFLAFLFEYVGHRIILARGPKEQDTSGELSTSVSPANEVSHPAESKGADMMPTYKANNLTNLGHNHGAPFDPTNPNSKLSVMVMEAGVLFHSILIGLTLVVAGDSFYRTLLVVIVFHQFFEGLALGARIALLKSASFWPTKFTMAIAFALITPLGMAIGLGVINSFNGNDRSTIVAIGTLDALSAGILMWVGLVDMWARDWIIEGGDMTDAKVSKVLIGGLSLISGLVLMSLLGKWA